MISGIRREVDDISALLGNHAAYIGNSLPTFLDKLSVKKSEKKYSWISCPSKMGRNRLSQNVGKELSIYAALSPRREQIPRILVYIIKGYLAVKRYTRYSASDG